MTDEMFPGMEETLSPKEKWKRDHNVIALKPPLIPGETGDDPQDLEGFDKEQWLVWVKGVAEFAQANTEEVALHKLAMTLGVKFYK